MTFVGVSSTARSHGTSRRRGVLLLVVLSMLTLFLLLGAAYLVAASRAKEAARAHARLTFGGDEVRTPYARLLDTVALGVIRGGVTPTAPGGGPPVTFESLLADKYSLTTLTGTATGVARTGPVVTAQLTLGSPVCPTDLNGRVLTFVEPGRAPTSHRIVRATSASGATNAPATTFTVALDVPARITPFVLPIGSHRVIINDREFSGAALAESWDGFDASNSFLARVATGMTMSTSTVSRMSYVGDPPPGFGMTWEYDTADSVPEAADNDGDGVPDGVFLDFELPDAVDAFGNLTQLRASVLIVDLDGRFNVNTHGSLAPVLYPISTSGTHPGWTNNASVLAAGSLAGVPMGSGYGPAEIAGNLGQGNVPKTPSSITSGTPRLFDSPVLATGTENPKLALLTGARPGATGTGVLRMRGQRFAGTRYTPPSSITGTVPTQRLRPAEGKYGEQSPDGSWIVLSATLSAATLTYARPGRPNIADETGMLSARRADSTAPASINFGIPPLWWNQTGTFNSGTASTAYPLPRGVFNSPPDLHGRMKTLTLSATTTGTVSTVNSGSDAVTPHLVFVRPEWSGTTTGEIRDNPYELQTDTRPGIGGCLKAPETDGQNVAAPDPTMIGMLADNPFTPSELESVLRPYDIDTNRCQPRLAALLGSAAEDSRLKVTTDSWDTTAVVGGQSGAAARLFQWLQSAATGTLYGGDPVTGIIGGEIARGERFDLNRALAAFETANAGYSPNNEYYVQRQAYFKDLYTLLVALEQGNGPTLAAARAAELAQWAANVVEFRDADSRITPFEYDKDPRNGWGVDGNVATGADGGGERAVVWGVERPEVLIRETFAWDGGAAAGGLVVSLHRPWNAVALSKTGTIAGEPCDYALDTLCVAPNLAPSASGSIPGNIVDLGKKAGPTVLVRGSNPAYDATAVNTYPIWRLRLVAGGTTFIRFDTPAAGVAVGTVAPVTLANGNNKPKLPVDTTLTIFSGTTVQLTKADGSTVTGTTSLTGSNCRMAATFRVPAGQASATLYLERLSDPSQAPTGPQWAADPLANLDTTTDTLRYVVVDSCTIANTPTSVSGTSVASQRRSTSNAATSFWRKAFVPGTTVSVSNPTATLPSPIPVGDRDGVKWFPWPNRPFVSAAELLLVPRGDSQAMLANYQMITEATAPAVSMPLSANLTAASIFDTVHVPTRFAGIHASGTANTFASTGISNVTTTVNQFSSFREPGRVNLNTITSADVWNTVVGGPLAGVAVPWVTANPLTTPAQNLAGLLAIGTSGGVLVSDTNAPAGSLAWDRNPLHRFYTATRLANTVTPRSNVFAVWITLREMTPGDPDSVRYHRAFYIVDRSIPVGHEAGRNHNVWDCVRVRRIIE